jgi:predicted DNA binding CopG/RHH family protein
MNEDMKKLVGPKPKAKKKTVSIRLSPEVIEAIKGYAKNAGVTFSAWVEWAIKQAK